MATKIKYERFFNPIDERFMDLYVKYYGVSFKRSVYLTLDIFIHRLSLSKADEYLPLVDHRC